MALYVSDLLTATAAPVSAAPTSTRTWQWLRGSSAISGATSATYTAVTADIGSPLAASQIEANVAGTATATSAPTETVQAFDPIRLFSASEPGVWYDPSDVSTLFKEAAGVSPVTAPGDTVGLMFDKSRGLVPGPELVTAGWTPETGNVVLSTSGTAIVATYSSTTSFYQAISVQAGKTYRATAIIRRNSGSGTPFMNFRSGPSLNNGVLGESNPDGYTSASYTSASAWFVAASTGTVYLHFPCVATASTAVSIDNISVKELPGNHASQATLASRPTYGIVPAGGRRNLLLWSEAINTAAVWTTRSSTATASVLTATAGAGDHDVLQVVAAVTGSMTFSVKLKAGTSNFAWVCLSPTFGLSNYATAVVNLATGAVTKTQASGTVTIIGTPSVSPVDVDGFYRVSFSVSSGGTGINTIVGITTSATPSIGGYGQVDLTAVGTETIQVKEAQLETSATATPYQRVTTQYDVTEAGVASLGYLRFDGTDDFMRTARMPTIAQPYQMWAALEPTAFVAANYTYIFDSFDGTNRAYLAFAGGTGSTTTGNYRMAAVTEIASATILSAGSKYVASASFSGAASEVRSNGVSVLTGNAGTGSFDGLTIGTRFSNSSYQNGKFFGGIVHGGAITAARINATEAWLNDRTGAY